MFTYFFGDGVSVLTECFNIDGLFFLSRAVDGLSFGTNSVMTLGGLRSLLSPPLPTLNPPSLSESSNICS